MTKRGKVEARSNGIGWAVVEVAEDGSIIEYLATGITESYAKELAASGAPRLLAAIDRARGGPPPSKTRKGYA